jgi:ABC-type transporter Mla subunit MlaD
MLIMVKQLRTTFVGIFIILAVIVFIILYTWFSGRIGLRNTYDITVYFNDVSGLRVGDPVMVYGLEKGKVRDLRIEGGRIKSILAIERDIVVPKDSKITILSISYLGGDRYVRIAPGNASESGVVFEGRSGGLDLDALASQLDSLIQMVKNFKLGDFNLDKIASKLARDVNRNIEEVSDAVKEPLEKVEHLAERTDSLINMLSGDGSFGRLIKSDELYQEIRETNLALKALIEDIKENPGRYINLKVF